MMSRPLQRLLASFAATAAIAFAAPAFAVDTVTAFYHPSRIGVAYTVGSFGYRDAEGDFVSLAGQQIMSSRVLIDFTPNPGVDVSTLRMEFAVPTIDAQSSYFLVLGTDLIETTPGTYHYELTTDLYNGTLHGDRFGWSTYGLTPDGAAVSLGGSLSAETGYYFTVTAPGSVVAPVPEASTYALMFGGLVAIGAVARRRQRR